MDLPGIYALANQEASLDEQIASRFVQRQQPDLLLNVIDAANLERPHLTLQLRELGLPMVVVLNKMDLLQKRRITIDEALLAKALGCPWCRSRPTIASRWRPSKRDPPVYRSVPARPDARLRSAPRGDIAELETLLAPIICIAVAAPCACWRKTSPCRRPWRRGSRRRPTTW